MTLTVLQITNHLVSKMGAILKVRTGKLGCIMLELVRKYIMYSKHLMIHNAPQIAC